MSNTPALRTSEATSALGSNNEFSITLPDSTDSDTPVDNILPLIDDERRILVLSGFPNGDAQAQRHAYAGSYGSMVFNTLRKFGINAAQCGLAYISSVPLSKSSKQLWRSVPAFAAGMEALGDFVSQVDPTVTLLLGDPALQAAFTDGSKSVENWRGSVVLCDDERSPLFGRKVMPTYDPMSVFIDWSKSPLFFFDLERLAKESTSKKIQRIPRDYEIYVSAERAKYLLNEITDIPSAVAMDIEGYVTGVTCISFATSPHRAFIVPLQEYTGQNRVSVLRALARFLKSSTPKILQNQLYDNFVLSYSYRMPIRNVVHDTMLSGWEIHPELPKSLAVQTSVWTDHPYYKMNRSSSDRSTLYTYCCTDSCITYEIALRHRRVMQARPEAYKHFQTNMSLLPALLYMQLRGLKYDKNRSSAALGDICQTLTDLQRRLDEEITACWKSHGSRGPAPASLNVNSPKQVADTLFVRFGYPKQHPKLGREVDKTKLTTNVDALLSLRKVYNGPKDQVLNLLLKYRSYEKMRQLLEMRQDKDIRVRCSYNLVGTETGRLTCQTSATGSGGNLTTVTKKYRYLYTADEGHWMFQCDLSGADGWTVAAHCLLRGDPTMMDDYKFGLKPAKIVVLMMRMGHAAVAKLSREELKVLCRTVDEDPNIDPLGWQYFAAKQVQHGKNYGLGAPKMSDNILKKSFKDKGETCVVSSTECQIIADAYMRRYPGIDFWHRHIKQQIDSYGELPSASGHTRKFFGRKGDSATHREAYAHEPQINTTWATNLAMSRLWNDSENRRNGKLVVEPLHHVHDALMGQFRKEDTAWAVPKIREWFNNPLTIAETTLVIPFEGAYGPSWGELGADYGGGRI